MSEQARKEVLIGGFVLGGLVLAGLVFWILERTSFEPKYQVKAEFGYAGGIRGGTPVHMAGKPIGSVSHVEFREKENRVIVNVVMDIEKQYKIKTDSKLTVGSVGLLGEKILEFSLGTGGAQFLPTDGTAYVEGTVPPGLEDLQKSLDGAVKDVKVTVGKVNEFLDSLNDQKFKDDLKRAVAGLADAAEGAKGAVEKVDGFVTGANEFVGKANTAADKATGVIEGADEVIAKLGEVADKLSTLADEAKLQITRTGDNVAELSESLQENSKRLNESLASLDTILKDAAAGKGTLGHLLTDKGTARKLDELLQSLRKTSDSLSATSDYLRRDPSSIVWGRDEEEAPPTRTDWRDRK